MPPWAKYIEQMRRLLGSYGYQVRAVDVQGCLHLKSAVTALADDLLLVNTAWISRDELRDFDLVEIDPAEPYGANALRIGHDIVYPVEFPRTRARMEKRGLRVHTVHASELAKAEGAVTCCSIVFAPLMLA